MSIPPRIPPRNVNDVRPTSILKADSKVSCSSRPSLAKSVSFQGEGDSVGGEKASSPTRSATPNSIAIPSEVNLQGRTYSFDVSSLRASGRAFQSTYNDKIVRSLS
eukprot:CAMPEP_0116561424 /NCGR_PEP_ID=MMETSP0397-20121206/11575_1 /TAXON_ID=216820 /ORGANISM="Cyclophora tenuis, Strain ECT3854" /LENGTH=105 /DNA_ID=CAMNT_0004087565 /DNA_START=197 /DNA_END=514 /DNA_ORIENTATION=-